MLSKYLKIAFRNLTKNRLFTFLNIAGLSVGLAAGLLMLLWTQDELSFDNFHRDTARIYRESALFISGGNEQAWAAVPAPHVLYALQEIPEVEKAVRVAVDYDKPVFH
jgi:putative ABC transport system permease protein